MNILSNQDGNNLLSSLIESNTKFGVSRLGITELDCVFYSITQNLAAEHQYYMLQNNAGLYGENFYNHFYTEYVNAIQKCNIHAIWDRQDLIEKHSAILNVLSPNSTKFFNRSIEPFYFDNPWSSKLKNKKVLIVSPFTSSILNQYNNYREHLWTNDILPQFELVTYKSVQSIGGSGPDNSWLDSLNRMKEEISQLDFDIALLGCGAYGVPLVGYIYGDLGKSAIYIGGSLQLLFGIRGNRWDNNSETQKFINNFWTRPSQDEIPSAAMSVEGACYW